MIYERLQFKFISTIESHILFGNKCVDLRVQHAELVPNVNKPCELISASHLFITLLRPHIYIYNSVCARRHKHINSSPSAQLNATQIAVMKGSHWRTWMVGPDILFSIYQCCFLAVFCAKWLHKAN